LSGKENYVADAISRTKIEENIFTDPFAENIPRETASCVSNQNYISLTERPLNYFSLQIKLIKGNKDTTEVTFTNKRLILFIKK